MGDEEVSRQDWLNGFLNGAVSVLKVIHSNGASDSSMYREAVLACGIANEMLSAEELPVVNRAAPEGGKEEGDG